MSPSTASCGSPLSIQVEAPVALPRARFLSGAMALATGAADEATLLTTVEEGTTDDEDATVGAAVDEADETTDETTDEEGTTADDEVLAAVLTADELADVTVTLVVLATARKKERRRQLELGESERRRGRKGRRTDVVLRAVRGERPRRMVARTVVVVDPGRVRGGVVGVERTLRAGRAARGVVAAEDRVLRRRDRERVGGRVGHCAVEGRHVEVAGALRALEEESARAHEPLARPRRAESASGPTRSERRDAVDVRCWRARTSRLREERRRGRA